MHATRSVRLFFVLMGCYLLLLSLLGSSTNPLCLQSSTTVQYEITSPTSIEMYTPLPPVVAPSDPVPPYYTESGVIYRYNVSMHSSEAMTIDGTNLEWQWELGNTPRIRPYFYGDKDGDGDPHNDPEFLADIRMFHDNSTLFFYSKVMDRNYYNGQYTDLFLEYHLYFDFNGGSAPDAFVEMYCEWQGSQGDLFDSPLSGDSEIDDLTEEYPMFEAYIDGITIVPGTSIGMMFMYWPHNGSEDTFPEEYFGGSDFDWSATDSSKYLEVYFLNDETPPTVDITGPVSGGGTYTTNQANNLLTWDGEDNYEIDHYEVWVDGTQRGDSISPFSPRNSSESVPLTLAEGTHVIEVRVYDKVGLSDSSTITLRVDQTDPDVYFTGPVTTGETYNTSSTTVMFTWEGSDYFTGFSSFDLYDLTFEQPIADGLPGTQWDFTGSLSEGVHSVRLTGNDEAGNTDSDIIIIHVDTSPPTVSLLSPSDGSYHPASTVQISWDADDPGLGTEIKQIVLYVDGEVDQILGAGQDQTTTNLPECSHTLKVGAEDWAGNTQNSSEITISVDLTAPTVTITHPIDPVDLTNDSVTSTIYWTASENKEIDYFRIIGAGSPIDLPPSAEQYTLPTLYTSTTVVLYCYDKAGHSGSDSIRYRFLIQDTTPPNVHITNPAVNGSVVASDFSVFWTGLDPESGISKYDVLLDNGPAIPKGSSADHHSFTGVSEGEHNVTVIAYNAIGLTNQSVIIVHVDLTNPTVSITSPLDGQYLTLSTFLAEWAAIDDFGISTCRVYLGNNLIINANETSYLFSNVPDGNYLLTIVTVDLVGNEGSDSINIGVDTSAPTVSINYPAEGSIVVGQITFRVQVDDETGVSYVVIRIVDLIYTNMTFNPATGYWEYSWDSTRVGNISYQITVTAVDFVGHSTTDEVTFVVQNPTEPSIFGIPESIFKFWSTVIGFFVAVIGIPTAIYKYKKSKKENKANSKEKPKSKSEKKNGN